MSKVIVLAWMSLDGVVQSPMYADEDASGGFAHGGWHPPYLEERSMAWLVRNVSGARGFLFGRRTYEVFAAHWPEAPDAEQELARPLNERPKYVASRTLAAPLAWNNAALLDQPVTQAVAELRRRAGGDLLVIGSTELAAALLAADLVDELRLMIDPILLGGGKRLFRDDGVLRSFTRVSSETVSTGAILATYARADADARAAASVERLPRPPRAHA